MGMQTQMTESQLVESRAEQTQGRLLVAAWVMAGMLAALVVALLVQGAKLAQVEQTVNQLQYSGSSSATDFAAQQQIDSLCRLIGAVAVKQGVSVSAAFDGQTLSSCEQAATEGASAARAGG